MKIKRHKKVHKYLNFFSNNFGFRRPFQVLIDGTFCFTALKNKVNIQDQLKSYLGGDVKLLTTKCVIVETETLGKHLYGAMLIVKQFGLHHCGHSEKLVSGSMCFQSMIRKSNPNRYIVATQDRELQDIARNVPGTPILYLHKKTPTLEEPSKLSINVANDRNSKCGLTIYDENNISQMKQSMGIKVEDKTIKKKRKKGGPNPLSCKKSKKKKQMDLSNQSCSSDVDKKKKRKRQRLKIPQHVKEELFNM